MRLSSAIQYRESQLFKVVRASLSFITQAVGDLADVAKSRLQVPICWCETSSQFFEKIFAASPKHARKYCDIYEAGQYLARHIFARYLQQAPRWCALLNESDDAPHAHLGLDFISGIRVFADSCRRRQCSKSASRCIERCVLFMPFGRLDLAELRFAKEMRSACIKECSDADSPRAQRRSQRHQIGPRPSRRSCFRQSPPRESTHEHSSDNRDHAGLFSRIVGEHLSACSRFFALDHSFDVRSPLL